MFKKPRDKFYEELDKQVPEWRRVNNDPKFAEWLNQRDEQTGSLKQDLFLKAYDMTDVCAMVAFFKEYIQQGTINGHEEKEPREFSYKEGDFIGGFFEVAKVLGKGGFGIVYLVYLGYGQKREVFALKTFRSDYLEDPGIKQRFLKEAELWVGLDKHPFLVRADFVLYVSDDPRPFIFMEYIVPNEDGLNSLDGYLRHCPPDLPQSLRWAIQFCHGMEYAHSKGIRAHRDIKPANIMISQEKAIKISDFGLASAIGTSKAISRIRLGIQKGRVGLSFQTIEGTGFGTPTHMPPEQFTNAAECDERSDIYSFGIVLYQMASGGNLPFLLPLPGEMSEREMLNFWRKMHELHSASAIPKLDNPLSPIIQHCVNKQPSQRYQSFKDLREDLEKVLKKITGEVIVSPKLQGLDAREWVNKGISLAVLKHYDEAIGCYDKALEMDSRNVDVWRGKGNVLHTFLKRYEEAITCYNKILEIEPNNGTIWEFKGNSLSNLGRFDEAITCFEKTLEIDPRFAGAWRNKGNALRGLGRFDEAILCYDRAIEIDPRNTEAWDNKGGSLVKLGRLDEAIICFDKALEIDPRYAKAWCNKGVHLANLGRLAQAIICCDKALEIDPCAAEYWSGKAIVLYGLGRFDEAITCSSKALEIEPQNVAALLMKTNILTGLKRYSEAIDTCSKALESNSKIPMLWYIKAFAEDKSCQNRDAIFSYRQFIALAPTQFKKEINYAQQRLKELKADRNP